LDRNAWFTEYKRSTVQPFTAIYIAPRWHHKAIQRNLPPINTATNDNIVLLKKKERKTRNKRQQSFLT
jgi:hypothetical protein